MNDWSDAERRVEKAQQFFEQRKWSDALREMRLATDINPYNPSWFFNIGLILDELGRFSEALEAYRQAAAIDPNDLHTLNHLGLDLYRIGRFDQAVKTFEQIQAIDPEFEPSYCNRIICYAELGDHELADEMFYTARLYREHCPHCYYNIGCSLEARGLYDKAIFCWTKSLDLDGAHEDVHVRIGHALWKKGDQEQARHHFLTDLRQNPGRTQTLLDLGALLMEIGRFDEADEKFRRAIELAPSDPGGHYCHGRLLMRLGHDEEAAMCFVKSLQLDPTFPGAHMSLGRICCRNGDLDGARHQLRAELQLRSDHPRLLLELSNLLMDVGDSRAALACLKWLVGLAPDEVHGWLNLAVAQFARGHYHEGITSCHTALTKDSGNIMAMYNLALAYEHLHQFDAGLVWIAQAIQRDPSDISLHRLNIRLRFLRFRSRLAQQVRRVLHWRPWHSHPL